MNPAIVLGALGLVFIGLMIAVMYALTMRSVRKALEEEPGPKDWTRDEHNLEPVKNIRTSTGDSDPFVTECVFAVGKIGPQKTFIFHADGEPQGPVPHISVKMVCDAADNPSGVICTYDILDFAGVGIFDAAAGPSSHVAAEKFGDKIHITVQTPVPANLAEDIQEKLNLYAKVPIKLHYRLELKGASILRSIDTTMRWKSPVQDEDLSAYISQFRS